MAAGDLDLATSGPSFDSLSALARDQGVACLVATHNVELAGRMDPVLRLRDGRLEA